jgi:hypothetical protein
VMHGTRRLKKIASVLLTHLNISPSQSSFETVRGPEP